MKAGDIFLIDENDPAAMSLAKKLCKDLKPGAIILLSQDELAAFDAIRIIEWTDKNKPTPEQSPE